MFENKLIDGDIYATRFIMSWVRMGGRLGKKGDGIDDFRKWLTSLNLNDEDIEHIMFIATSGKLELEISARNYLESTDK